MDFEDQVRTFWEQWVKPAFEADALVSLIFLGGIALAVVMAFWKLN